MFNENRINGFAIMNLTTNVRYASSSRKYFIKKFELYNFYKAMLGPGVLKRSPCFKKTLQSNPT